MSNPWAFVRISIERPEGVPREEVWIGSVPVYPGDNIAERVGTFMAGWANSQFKDAVESSWSLDD